jgi:hypothetical protein
VFTEVIGRPVWLVENQTRAGWLTGEEKASMFNFFNGKGYDANSPALRAMYPDLQTLEQYLRRNDGKTLNQSLSSNRRVAID